MQHGFKIARVFGIDIAIHPSWFIILAVLVWSLAENVFPSTYVWSKPTYWLVAVAAALLLFVSVLVHELAHSLIAKHQGIPVKNITLFLLGGVSTLQDESASPGKEALMAGAGPLSSIIIGGITFLAGRAVHSPQTARAILLYLGSVNLLLGVFNMLPGFPLDGGRVLRAALWKRSGDLLRATRGAARTGTILGYLLVALGVAAAIFGSLLGGIWTGFVGWILVQASQAAYQQTKGMARLAGIPVSHFMTPAHAAIPAATTLRAAADDYFLTLHTRCLPVANGDGRVAGVVCLSDLKQRTREQWADDHVSEVMTPRERLLTVEPHESSAEALRLMGRHDVNQAAVVKDGELIGFVSRGRLLHAAEADAEGGPAGTEASDEGRPFGESSR
jgi:Zn-dependent protease/CBS domain-containing protein